MLATRESATSTAAWTRVCTVGELEPFWGEAALIGREQIALFLLPDGSLYAVTNQDPATGAFVMSRGIVGSKGDRHTITSPLHKQVYDLESGECYTAAEYSLQTFPVRVDDGVVKVEFEGRDSPRPPVLLAVSHGTNDPAGQRAVAALVAAVSQVYPDLTVLGSFVDVQRPDVETSLGTFETDSPVVIVPLLLSAGYHVHVDLVAAAVAAPRHVDISGALGPDPRLARLLAFRLREAGLESDDHVVMAAAGSSDASAVADCHLMGKLLADALDRPVEVGFISAAAPALPAAVEAVRAASPGSRVIIASYLLAPGYFAGLAHTAGADLVSAPLLRDGEAPSAALVELVAERYARVLAAG